LSYQVKGAEFAAMDLHGDSQTTGLDASYPVIRSTTRNLYASANFDFKHYQNLAGSTVTSDYTVRVARLGLSANSFDEWQGGGQNNGSLSLVLGTVDLSGSPNQAADAAAARTDGAFQKIQYTASRHQSLGAQWSVYGALSGQWASKNLESGEKFYLGGAQGVRAYPSSEAGGADGQLLNLELRYRWRQDLNLAAFYDWGQVRVNHDNGFPGAAARNSLSLQGLGLSVGWSAPMGVNLSAAWAHRLGSNPNPTASGKDQDGSLVRNRLWITASLPL
jgi:hemolysin activation/secretion protein